MNYKYVFLTVLLALPFRTLAVDVVDAAWEDVSPVHGDRSLYDDRYQHLYTFGKDVYLSRYERSVGGDEVMTMSLEHLQADNTWRYLMKHYSHEGDDIEAVKYNHGLYFGFGYSLYRINKDSVLSPITSCSGNYTMAGYAYKKRLYIYCNQALQALDRGIGYPYLVKHTTGESATYDFNFYPDAGKKFLGKYYLFGGDGPHGGKLKSFVAAKDGSLVQNLAVPDMNHYFTYSSVHVFDDKLYWFIEDTSYGTTDMSKWGTGHAFPRRIKGTYQTDNLLYALGYSPKRKHPIDLYYYNSTDGWNKVIAGTHIFTEVMTTYDSYLYVVSKEADEQYIVMRSSDALSWSRVGNQTFESVADIEVTSEAVYVVTEESQVYKAFIE